MTTSPTTALQIFGEIRQMAWVVPQGTFQTHIDHWVNSLGVGPWIIVERPPVINVMHRGKPSELNFSFAIAHMGTIQVEIIEQHDDAPTTYSEFITATNGKGGLHHIAFTLANLGDLLGTYSRLKAKGIEPFWCINHGPTMSMYYKDPDGNQVELQVDAFDKAGAASYFDTEPFAQNPIGVLFDADKMCADYEAGVPDSELLRRPD